MKNKTRQLLDNLIHENNELRQENERLRARSICDFIDECETLIKANMTINALRKELEKEKRRNALLMQVR